MFSFRKKESSATFGERVREGLARTRGQWQAKLSNLFSVGKIDEAVYEQLETLLLTSDVGVAATEFLLKDVRRRVKSQKLSESGELKSALKSALVDLLASLAQPLDLNRARPLIIMIAGVNGSGKTTSIGKLALVFREQGKSVLLAAGDTFRAAAREQLQIWGERNQVAVMANESGDSASVIFDAIGAARARRTDILLADTAGRLPTQRHLMEEIKKVKRVIAKAEPSGPHEVWLTLDANTGQNAVAQVKTFDDALKLTGLIVTKLDGTAKGGVLAAIARERPIPIRYIGVGEALEDLRPFDVEEFVSALID
ncbi:MAG TPA: signal recognition particle-docking protein FtsY [Burkholderiales bacterium]|nr:signal recognition particle-docking protein FtsY [Burkholderiales bacterium]